MSGDQATGRFVRDIALEIGDRIMITGDAGIVDAIFPIHDHSPRRDRR